MNEPAAETPARPSRARDIGLIARFELAEAIRTRLLLVMVVLFVGAGALAAWGVAAAVERVEHTAASALGAPVTRKPGAAFRRMRDSRSYQDMLRSFLGSEEKAAYFARVPPIAVFFGWASFLFTPWLLLFTSSETIASELASRSIRYAALRTGRASIAIGKALGQLLVLAGVTALMGVAFFAVAWLQLSGFEAGPTAAALLSYWPRVLIYNVPFLGWAMCASMVTSSGNVARLVALSGAVGLAILGGLSGGPMWRRGPVTEALCDFLGLLTPFGHRDGLFYPPGGTWPADVVVCLALGALYFFVGYLVLRRRDI